MSILYNYVNIGKVLKNNYDKNVIYYYFISQNNPVTGETVYNVFFYLNLPSNNTQFLVKNFT